MAVSQEVFWPVNPDTITEEAGTRGGEHYGMDFGVPVGTPILSPFDGVVVACFNDGASGFLASAGVWANGPALIVDVERADGLIARFAHCDSFYAKVGQRVKAGDWVAFTGNSGFTSGPHLHWEMRWDRNLGGGRWVNPRAFDPQIFEGATVAQTVPVLPVYESEDDMAEYYFEATGDSTPVNGKPRIKAGVQKIGGVTYANVWERVGGAARRLFDAEWSAMVAYRAANNLRPLVPQKLSGNAIEQIVFVEHRAESKE